MFGQCGFPFARLQYTWTDVSWLAGETTEALVCPHKLRASEPILTIVTTVQLYIAHLPDDAHVRTLFPLAVVG